MTVYYQTLALQYVSTNPTPTTLNIASGDTIELGIDTSSYGDGNGWLRFGTPIGCTTSATSGADGGAVTITPNVGATSYSVTFRTLISETSSYLYGRIAGTISTGGGGSDTTPDAFSFTDQTNVSLSTTITSGAITVSGIDAASAISISGGTYSINGGAYTSSSGTVTNGQTVTVRHTSSASNSTATNTTLTIGGVSDTFTSTTAAAAATYTINFYNTSFGATSTFNEGESFYVFISTTGVPDGTYYWSSSSGSDLVAPVNGSFAISSNFGSLYLTIAADSLTEGTETLTFYIRSGSVSGTILATSSAITINDTSTSPADTTPDSFTFTDQTNVALSSTITSNTITVSGISAASAISISGGTYSINGGAYTATSGTVTNGQTVSVRHTSSASNSTATNTTLTIGGVSDTFTSTTLALVADTTPDAFTFTDQTGVALNSTITSNTITVSGINTASAISITGGTYSISGGAYTSTSGTVTNGQTVTVRHTSSASNSTATNTTLTIGGVSDIFTSTTLAFVSDTTPDAFTFTDQTSVALNTTITSDTITVSGINAASAISISGGTYSINGGAYTSTSGTVTNGQTVSVRHTSSATNNTAVNTTLTIGGVSDTFTSTTLAGAVYDTTPDPFSFTDRTGAATNTAYTDNITITGLEPNYSITITATGGTVDATTALPFSGVYASSKTVTTSATGTIIVSAKAVSSPTAGTQVDCVVTIGTLSDTFSVTTYAAGTQVDQFTFTDVENAAFSTVYTSNTITISGLNAGLSTSLSVTSGTTYSKNGGAYSSTNGISVANGDTINVRVTSSANYSSPISSTLSIFAYAGSTIYSVISDTFTVTTPKFNYSLTPNFISIYEGTSIPLVLETIGVANGTTLYWTLNGATTADFSAVSGSFTVNSNTGTFSITASPDALTEGTETYTLAVRSGSTAGTVLTTSTVLITDPPANAYGMQIFDSNGSIVMDTNTYTVKEVKYSVSVTASTSISVPSIVSDTVAQVIELSTGTDPLAVGNVSIDYINKLLVVSGGSGFLATINLMDYR